MHGNKKLNQNNRGFTLIELIITVVILALVTAPFLSSFVTAGNTNVKSKRVQEANELSQYIIEQFKASNIDMLEHDYGMVKTTSPVTKYTKTLSVGDGLPDKYGSKYTAEIEVTEKSSVINENVIPVLEELQEKQCVVFANSIYAADASHPGALMRDITVEVSYDTSVSLTDPNAKPYVVSLTVDYQDGTSPVNKTVKSEFVPNLYILYMPKSPADVIRVKNQLNVTQLKDGDGNPIKLNAYIIKQTTSPDITVNESNVFITEADNPLLNKSLENLINGINTISNTTLYTNIGVSGANDDGSLNKPIKTKQITALYDLNIKVKYEGKEIAEYNATKFD
ncbi:MAG: type II secretion system GspH family protein [Lachnospiraceae bacterium]|nr:type II secretion system GspH family protein [Lachnospiraceae bacterium]